MASRPVKKTRSARTKRRSSTAALSPRRTVTRREYAELVVRLGSVELQAQRNRTTLDVLAQRVAQMQEELNLLHLTRTESRAASDLPGVAIPPPPTVES